MAEDLPHTRGKIAIQEVGFVTELESYTIRPEGDPEDLDAVEGTVGQLEPKAKKLAWTSVPRPSPASARLPSMRVRRSPSGSMGPRIPGLRRRRRWPSGSRRFRSRLACWRATMFSVSVCSTSAVSSTSPCLSRRRFLASATTTWSASWRIPR